MRVSWETLRRVAVTRAPDKIQTSLLGRVPHDGDGNSVITASLQYTANRHGLMIVAADHKRNIYTLRTISDRYACDGKEK